MNSKTYKIFHFALWIIGRSYYKTNNSVEMDTIKLNTPIILIVIFFSFNTCKGQVNNGEKCKVSYTNAITKMGEYYKTPKISLLQESLRNIEESMLCHETRRESINLKISLLLLMKKYQRGYMFIDSLDNSDFDAPYKKKMRYDEFHAFDYESKLDTASRNRVFWIIVNDIQEYIQNENMGKDTLNEEAYIFMFSFKQKLIGLKKADAEIDSLKVKYPLKGDYLDALKNAIMDSPITDSVSATQN
jgi:hypothetical protein